MYIYITYNIKYVVHIYIEYFFNLCRDQTRNFFKLSFKYNLSYTLAAKANKFDLILNKTITYFITKFYMHINVY